MPELYVTSVSEAPGIDLDRGISFQKSMLQRGLSFEV